MATLTGSAPTATTIDGFRPHRLTIERYYQMIEAGVFGDQSPVFLWQGQLVEPMVKGQPHVYAVTSLHGILFRLVPQGWFVGQEHPVALGNESVPEPDLVIVRGALRDYPRRPPTAADVSLLVEVSDTSLAADSRGKLRAYATAGIPAYWIVNLTGRRIEVYTDPTGPADVPGYRSRRDFGPDEEVPVVLDGREVGRVALRDVLP